MDLMTASMTIIKLVELEKRFKLTAAEQLQLADARKWVLDSKNFGTIKERKC